LRPLLQIKLYSTCAFIALTQSCATGDEITPTTQLTPACDQPQKRVILAQSAPAYVMPNTIVAANAQRPIFGLTHRRNIHCFESHGPEPGDSPPHHAQTQFLICYSTNEAGHTSPVKLEPTILLSVSTLFPGQGITSNALLPSMVAKQKYNLTGFVVLELW